MKNFFSNILNAKYKSVIFFIGLLFLGIIASNDGFIATDEYWTGIYRYIPAQKATVFNIVNPDDVKSPLQIMPMLAIAKSALALGIENPYLQYRTVIFGVGLINFLLFILCLNLFSDFFNHSKRERNFTILISGLYFGMGFALTRPMFESIAAPWLTLSALFALRYEKSNSQKDLICGVSFASLAFVLRQQLGICALTFVFWPLFKKRWKDFVLVSGLGLIYFIISGIPDYFLRGKFHYSLLNLTVFNFQHGGDYGNQPITFYPAMIIAITFSPFLIAKYPEGFLKKTFNSQKSLWIYVVLFVFLHSLFPQKWERFLISLMPILVMIVEPYLFQLQSEFNFRKARLISLYGFNLLLFVVAGFFPAQKSIISLSLFLTDHPKIQNLYRIDTTPEWFTDVFVYRDTSYKWNELNVSDIQKIDWNNCANALVLSEPVANQLTAQLSGLTLLDYFNVNLIEQIAFKINPKNNNRRVQLRVYGCAQEKN